MRQQSSAALTWDFSGRAVIFFLSATSIWCLLAELYGLCSMRGFAIFVLLPSTLLLIVLALFDRRRGQGHLWRAVIIGSIAGFVAAVAYDLFRVPFVFATELGIDGWLPSMRLFKVFPRFGAMLLGEPVEQASYSVMAHVLGWIYHFSNGMTFGVMYLSLIGDATRRHWIWAVSFAVGLELAMLFTPYPNLFSIHVTSAFVVVTVLAHLVFGVSLGLCSRRFSRRTTVLAHAA